MLAETAELTGVMPKRAQVDKGYRGHKQDRAVFEAQTRRDVRPFWRVYISGKRNMPPAVKPELRRSAAIEPVIGHMKASNRMAATVTISSSRWPPLSSTSAASSNGWRT